MKDFISYLGKVKPIRNMQFACIDVINAARHIAAWDNLQPGELICFHKDLKGRRSRKGENDRTRAALLFDRRFSWLHRRSSLIQHFYEGGQNPFRTIRRQRSPPRQDRERRFKRTLSDRGYNSSRMNQSKYYALSRRGVCTRSAIIYSRASE